MVETAIAAPEKPSTPAAPLETPERDWSQLDELIGDEPETPEAPAAVIPATTESAKEVPAPAVDEPPAELKALDALLAADKTEPEPEAPKPAAPLSPEAQQLDQIKADPALTADFLGAARSMLQLEQAIATGDMKAVVGLFAPAFQNALAEHIYQQNKEAFVQRFIDEHEGKATTPDPRVAHLETQLAEIQSTLTERQKREQQQEQQTHIRKQQESYNNYWNALFQSVTPKDGALEPKTKSLLRGWVLDSIAESARSGDKDALKAIEAIKQGRYAPIGLKFREVYSEWIKDQKAKTTADTSIRNAQEQKQAGKLGTSPAETTVIADQDFDADGKRTKGYWERGLKTIGLI